MMRPYLMKLFPDEKKELENIKKITGYPFATIIRKALREYIKKFNDNPKR